MVNLADVLKKSKGKFKEVESRRTIIIPAMDDRPYDFNVIERPPNITTQPEVSSKFETNVRQPDEKNGLSLEYETNIRQEAEQEQPQQNKQIDSNEQDLTLQTVQISSSIVKSFKPKQKKKQQPKILIEDNNESVDFIQLTGLQRQITCYVYELCKSRREKVTPPLAVEVIAESCKINKLSIRKTIQRLESKKILRRFDYKEGRGGWTRYELSESIYQAILQQEQWGTIGLSASPTKTNINTLVDNSLSQEPGITKENLLIETNKYENSPWREIEFSDLTEEIGFKKEHIMQLSKSTDLTPEVVQNSIYYYMFDLKHNNLRSKIKTNAISYFMGIMRRQGVYTPPQNYVDPKSMALKQYLLKQNEIEENKKNLQKAIEELAFNRWNEELKEEDKQALYSDEVKKLNMDGSKNAFLKKHFVTNVWPDIKNQYDLDGIN